jgi:hypothetical protein
VLQDSLNKDLAPALKKNETAEIKRVFSDPVPFTQNAPMTTKWANFDDLTINFKLRDQADGGNSPDRYLYPQTQDAGTEIYVTRFSRRLRYQQQITGDEYVMHWGYGIGPGAQARGGRVSGGFVSAVLAGLSKDKGASSVGPLRRGSDYARAVSSYNRSPYFILGSKIDPKEPKKSGGNGRRRADLRSSGFVGPGIYTRNGKDLQRVFALLTKIPKTTAKRYDWSPERIFKAADPVFTAAVDRRLKAAMNLRPDYT